MTDSEISRTLDRALGRLEGKLDLTLASITDHIVSDREIHEELRRRVGGLEMAKSYGIGVAATVGALITLLGEWFMSGWHGK